MEPRLRSAQRKVLQAVVASRRSDVYLVGGTALAMRCHHRESDDLDFFIPSRDWTARLPDQLMRQIVRATGFKVVRREARLRGRRHVWLVRYDLQIGLEKALKVDVVEDLDPLLQPVGEDRTAALDDLYLRKIRAAIGWTNRESKTGLPLPGGRTNAARDVFDLWYLSTRYVPLAEWFPKHFTIREYARLAAWLRAVTTETMVLRLLEDIRPTPRRDLDVRAIRRHLEKQVYQRLNRRYIQSP